MWSVGLSILVDVVWYIVGVRTLWEGHTIYPNEVGFYMRLIVVLYGVVDFGKLIMLILLVSEYNTDESEKKVVSVFGLF